jgi:uncharacterized protein YqeY
MDPASASRAVGTLLASTPHNGAMSTLKETLQADLTTAIRSRDELTAATLRMALTAVTNEEVSGKSARMLSDAEVMGVLTKEAKKRREAAAAFTDASRPELADRELAELGVLDRYLPEPLTAEEVSALVDAAVARLADAGVTGMSAMGRVMKDVTPQVAGRFDGGQLATMVRAALA